MHVVHRRGVQGRFGRPAAPWAAKIETQARYRLGSIARLR